MEHCDRDADAGDDKLKDDVLKHYVEEESINDEDEVQDNVLISDAQKLTEPLLAVCCLVKNWKDEGERRRKRGRRERWRKKNIFCDNF